MSWQTYKLGDLLVKRRDSVRIDPDRMYKLVTIRLHHKGIALRCLAQGSDIKSKMSAIRSGDFLLSGIDARNGAFGIVPQELDGAVVTNDFWCLEPNKALLDRDYLLLLSQTEEFDYICRVCSEGITQRIRLQRDKFLESTVSIPSVPEQKSIVQHIDNVRSKSDRLTNELNGQSLFIDKLRQAFLREAMQGKLVPQDPNDEPASELLKRIKAEKAKLVKEKKIKAGKELPPIKPDEIPYPIPDNWLWCRLGEICDLITKGSSPKWQGVRYVDSKDDGILFITSKNVRNYRLDLSEISYVEKKFNSIEPRSILKKGDLLTNIVGGSIGRTASYDLDDEANINQAVCVLRIEHHYVEKSFLLFLMNSDMIIRMMFSMQFAPGRANLSMVNVSNFLIPIPPLSEQRRIIAKLSNLSKIYDEHIISIVQSMKLIDQLLKATLREALSVSN